MTLETFKQLKSEIELRLNKASDELNMFPVGQFGGVSEEARQTPEFKKAKQEYDKAFSELKTLNGNASNKIKRELSKLKRLGK